MRTTFTLGVLLVFAAASAQAQWSTNGGNIYFSGGFVGVGTTTPGCDLHVSQGNTDSQMRVQTLDPTRYAYGRFMIPANSTVNDTQAGFFFQEGAGNFTAGNRIWTFGFNPVADNFQILGGGSATAKLVISAAGNVGIGTSTPAALLDVNGSVNVAGNIAAKYQDVAEWVNADEPLEPGTVVVLNPNKSNQVMASHDAYDTAVAGVVSANPGLILGESGTNKEKVATTGRVKVRVDATRGPIHVGDLLVSADTPGTAMKSIPVEVAGVKIHRPGTIIGKALEPLERGEGEILVLLTLQ